MARNRYAPEQTIGILHEAEVSLSFACGEVWGNQSRTFEI